MGMNQKRLSFDPHFIYVSKLLPTLALPNESLVIIIKKYHSARRPHIVITHHYVNQDGNGVDKCPDPLAVGLWIDGAGRRANG